MKPAPTILLAIRAWCAHYGVPDLDEPYDGETKPEAVAKALKKRGIEDETTL